MKLMEIKHPEKPIVLVFGRLCSGKGTYCEAYADQGYHHITTSDIVKRLSGHATRDQLQGTKDLDAAIGEEMVKEIAKHDKIIIDGIRQTKIVDAIVDAYGDKVDMIWLDVPERIRRDRFVMRGAAKDNQTFDDAEAGDTTLGLDDVEKEYKPKSRLVQFY